MDFYNRFQQVVDIFKNDNQFKACQTDDTLSEWKVYKKYSKKELDEEWINAIEEALPHLDVIVRNPRRFIVVEEDLVDTSRARSVNEEAVKFLATHTNFIHGIDKERDMVLPSKLLNSTKEESFEVYENRFIFTLIKKVQVFVKTRYDAILAATSLDDHVKIVVDKGIKYTDANISMRLDSTVKVPFEKAVKMTQGEGGTVERLAKIYNIVSGFMTTPFAREMAHSAPVRPPIQHTNAILKNNDFKKALKLWDFLQTYDKEGFEIKPIVGVDDMTPDVKEQYRLLVYLNSLFAQNLLGADLEFEGEYQEQEERTKEVTNIENYPKSDIGLEEVKHISVSSVYGYNDLSDVNRVEINSALDRVFTQYRINVAKDNSKEKMRRVVAQRKMETEYKDKILKLRKKEAELLIKLERKNEKNRLIEEAELADETCKKITKKQLKAFEDELVENIKAQIEAEAKRITEDALKFVRKQVKKDMAKENESRISEQVANLNTLRRKIKASVQVKIDSEVDRLIDSVPGFYETEV